jgi:hypothetical protein
MVLFIIVSDRNDLREWGGYFASGSGIRQSLRFGQVQNGKKGQNSEFFSCPLKGGFVLLFFAFFFRSFTHMHWRFYQVQSFLLRR